VDIDHDSVDVERDLAGTDLSPRPVVSTPRRKRKTMPSVVLAVMLIAGGFVVFKFLTASTTFFCNADEIGVKADCAASKHIRLQGTVESGSVNKQGAGLTFKVGYNNVIVPVVYGGGDPGGVFCEGVPVVVEGVYSAGSFQGDRILTKHTENYKAGNPNRVRDCGI
jgi:cytochrome c-type biogenesis protein CcmE